MAPPRAPKVAPAASVPQASPPSTVACLRCHEQVAIEQLPVKDYRHSWKYCVSCYELIVAEKADQRKQERRDTALQDLRAHIAGKLNKLPRFRPRTDESDFKRAVPHEKLRTVAERYTLERGSLLLLGPSGCGKTTTAQAIVQRLGDQIIQSATADEGEGRFRARSLGCLDSFVWTTGNDIVHAYRDSKLGSEPELLVSAKAASFLVIDDVGLEPFDNILFHVIDSRYSHCLPSIVTTGLTTEGFIARYGEALDRRLTEKGIGAPIEIPPKKKGNLNLVRT
jgi:DNA replication protein DnaC